MRGYNENDIGLHDSIPVFSHYKQRENQVSHGFAVTLDQCVTFKQRFFTSIFKLLPNTHPIQRFSIAKLVRDAQIVTQSHFSQDGTGAGKTQTKSIPDILIEWDQSDLSNESYRPCIMIEAKVEASWDNKQAQNHLRFARKAGYHPIGVAITTDGIPQKALPEDWVAFSWREVYLLARSLGTHTFWSNQFSQLLETTEEHLMMSSSYTGSMVTFSGIPFADEQLPYHPIAARRVMRQLIQALLEKGKDFKKIGISVSEPTSISSSENDSIWYEADPLPIFKEILSPGTKTPHLNITLGRDSFSCGLTFPNASFKKVFRRGVSKLVKADAFDSEIHQLTQRLMKTNSLKVKSTPYCYLTQQHYITQKSIPHQDGLIKMDLRTLTGYHNKRQKLNIKPNPLWLTLLTEIATDRTSQCHLQTGFGVTIPYTQENQSFFASPTLPIDFIFMTWKALLPFANKIGMR